MTLLGAMIEPQQEPRCHASTMAPLGWIASEGYSLWLVLRRNSSPATTGTKGVQLTPPSVEARAPTVLKLPDAPVEKRQGDVGAPVEGATRVVVGVQVLPVVEETVHVDVGEVVRLPGLTLIGRAAHRHDAPRSVSGHRLV